ncbi:MAG TPA: SDR family oxidoreductase, partial [Chitinophagaceae bacterium]|nr:SDR family oxidoreductase [Chitinophagaceae bacterium]
MKSRTNYLLTGATGLLGRNLLFEIIKQHSADLSGIKIFLLGRHSKEHNLATRIFNIIENDGTDYLSIGQEGFYDLCNTFASIIHYIDFELESTGRLLSQADEMLLRSRGVDYFFHIASHTDFRSTDTVKKKLWSVNVDGTTRVLELAKKLRAKHFIYTGSAYACGETTGNIAPDYVNFNQKFRNPYELSKLEAEVLVRNFSEQQPGINVKFFRPSTICGRLIEDKIGAISKFDVFYGWMFFFLRCKERMFRVDDLNKTALMKCRIAYSLTSGLNMVPADYAAKAMYRITMSDASHNSFHLVNAGETNHDTYIRAMTKAINMEGMQQVDSPPVSN